MEGNFNFFNKTTFGYKAVRALERVDYMTKDQYSQQGSTAEDAKLDNRLTLDISRQLCQPMTAVSADADKCYDRIYHIVLALALKVVWGKTGAITAMLEAIQHMHYY